MARASSLRDRRPRLAVDVGEVVFDGLRADEQRGGDLAVGHSLADEEGDSGLL